MHIRPFRISQSPFSCNILVVAILTIAGIFGCDLVQPDEDKDEKDVEVSVTFSVSHKEVSLLPGDTLRIFNFVTPDTVKIADLVWSSSNPQVASVSSTGLVTALSIGQAQITVSSAAKKAQAVSSIFVTPTMLNQIYFASDVISAYINQPKHLNVSYEPEDATDKNLTWETSDNSIVSVDQTGTITAKKLGYAWVSAHQQDQARDNAIIVPAHAGQLMAASQINVTTHEQTHFIDVYLAALEKAVVINEVKLYLGIRGDVNSSELKTVNSALTLNPGSGGKIAIEVNSEEANQLTYGRYVRIDASIGGVDYYVYVSWMNNIEFVEK